MPCRKNVLVVDDDQAVRDMLKDVLEIEGYDVAVAGDGQEGIRALSSMSSSPCAIILDMMMPVMNGWQFLDFQRNNLRFAGIPVIVCSAFRGSAASVKPEIVVPKPIDLRALLGAIDSLCA